MPVDIPYDATRICGQCNSFLANEFTEYTDDCDRCVNPWRMKNSFHGIYVVTPRTHCQLHEPLDELGKLALIKLSQENNLPSGDIK